MPKKIKNGNFIKGQNCSNIQSGQIVPAHSFSDWATYRGNIRAEGVTESIFMQIFYLLLLKYSDI